jgi:hypothetical protein
MRLKKEQSKGKKESKKIRNGDANNETEKAKTRQKERKQMK